MVRASGCGVIRRNTVQPLGKYVRQHYSSNLDVRKTRSSATKTELLSFDATYKKSARGFYQLFCSTVVSMGGSSDCVGMDAEEVKGGVLKKWH
uniref:Uncharacterized protein n=1 Tax=Ditylenchus dipsaci TaxID=166011 RepID=A0A915DQG4_9BILA